MSLRPRQDRGFTLIELLVVIAIIAVLIGLLLPAVQRAREAVNHTTAQNNLKTIAFGAERYRQQTGNFPTSLSALESFNLVDAELADGSVRGYHYTYSLTATGFTATAVPDKLGVTGLNNFKIDQSNTITISGNAANLLYKPYNDASWAGRSAITTLENLNGNGSITDGAAQNDVDSTNTASKIFNMLDATHSGGINWGDITAYTSGVPAAQTFLKQLGTIYMSGGNGGDIADSPKISLGNALGGPAECALNVSGNLRITHTAAQADGLAYSVSYSVSNPVGVPAVKGPIRIVLTGLNPARDVVIGGDGGVTCNGSPYMGLPYTVGQTADLEPGATLDGKILIDFSTGTVGPFNLVVFSDPFAP